MRSRVCAGIAACLCLVPTAALAYGGASSGTTELVIGWAVEPAFAGFPNAVSVEATHDGKRRNDAELKVTVLFGGEDADTATEPMRLERAFGQNGVYEADLLPTEAGRYTFQITGTVGEDDIDVTMTSGEGTFNDVAAPAELQFPTQVPATTELAAAVEQLTAQSQDATAARAEAQDAKDSAANARLLAIFALGVGALSALFGFAALRKAGP